MRKNPVVWALILVVRGLIAIVRSSPRNWGRILLNIPDLIFNTNIDHDRPVISAHLGQNIEDIYCILSCQSQLSAQPHIAGSEYSSLPRLSGFWRECLYYPTVVFLSLIFFGIV